MSVLDCIARLARAGKISEAQAKDARAIYEGVLNEDALRDMDQATREAHAALKNQSPVGGGGHGHAH